MEKLLIVYVLCLVPFLLGSTALEVHEINEKLRQNFHGYSKNYPGGFDHSDYALSKTWGGNCTDYALTLYSILRNKGYNPSIIACYYPHKVGHARVKYNDYYFDMHGTHLRFVGKKCHVIAPDFITAEERYKNGS